MLAVIKAMEGLTIDVITSSPELAKPQTKELKNFYKMFNLTVSHNGNDKVEKFDIKLILCMELLPTFKVIFYETNIAS